MFKIRERSLGPGLRERIGSMRAVKRAMNRAFMLITASTSSMVYVERVRNAGRVMGFPPTLLTRIEICRSSIDLTAAWISSGVDVRQSRTTILTTASCLSFWSVVLATASSSGRCPRRTMAKSCFTSACATPRPIPALDPVMRAYVGSGLARL